MMISKKLRLPAVACLMIAWGFTSSLAQAGDAAGSKAGNSLEDGAWAVQFQIDSDKILTSFGGAFAVKRHTSRRSAYRVGVDFSFIGQENEIEHVDLKPAIDTLTTSTSIDESYQRVGLFVHYLRYVAPDAPVNFFWGTGPFLRFVRDKSDRYTVDRDGLGYANESLYKTWEVGGDGRLGVEWFATRTLSFHGEYSFAAYYRTGSRETSAVDPDGDFASREEELTGWVLDRGTVLFGLSAYF